jgi:hypothetical protein
MNTCLSDYWIQHNTCGLLVSQCESQTIVSVAGREVPVVTGVFTDLLFNNLISDSKFTSPDAQGDQHLTEIRSDEVSWKKPTPCSCVANGRVRDNS